MYPRVVVLLLSRLSGYTSQTPVGSHLWATRSGGGSPFKLYPCLGVDINKSAELCQNCIAYCVILSGLSLNKNIYFSRVIISYSNINPGLHRWTQLNVVLSYTLFC